MSAPALQPSFDDLGRPLADVTFVVVDLETTGSGAEDTITEIGAVKVRGGQVLGEFGTLVNPLTHIPGLIAVLTGITDQMVASAPTLPHVLPAFLEFLGDGVVVAHNARFDVGFLKRACAQHDYTWRANTVVDTVALARTALLRDEVANCKLATLARHFHASTEPNHRALSDARATVDVLHGLLERVGNLGVGSLEDLIEFMRQVSPQRRAKRTWAAALPDQPGIYQFVCDTPAIDGGTRRQVLYVGKSKNIRQRVRTYFTAAETRPRMDEMVRIATGVEATVCRTTLEADVLELRLIAAHEPRYNRRSKYPERQHWLKLTDEAFPRLSLVRRVANDGGIYFGPFSRRSAAEDVMASLYDAFPLRQCTKRLSTRSPSTACALAELGRCSAPCLLQPTAATYHEVAEAVAATLSRDVRPVLTSALARMGALAEQQRYEEAGVLRRRLETYLHAARRHHRVGSLAACPHLVAARRPESGLGWEIHVVRHGRLAAAALCRPDEVPQAIAREAVAVAESVQAPLPPQPAATIEETERIADWLEQPGVRLIEIDGDWMWPLHLRAVPAALALAGAAPASG